MSEPDLAEPGSKAVFKDLYAKTMCDVALIPSVPPGTQQEVVRGVFAKLGDGLVFQPIQRNVLAAADISMLDVALDIRNYQEDGGCVDHEDMVIITKVLDDEVNARLSGSISNSIVEKINGVKVKGLTHAYELLYPENMPEYVVIELKNGERPLVFEGKAMETANKRISKTYNIPKNARLDSAIPGRQPGRNTTPAR